MHRRLVDNFAAGLTAIALCVVVAGCAPGPTARLTPATTVPSATSAPATFRPTGSMAIARSGATATLLPDGRVLIAGGGNSTDALASAELYDPESGTFSATGSMTTARFGGTATLLEDGRVLIAGGSDWTDVFASAELYDPATGTFATTGSMTSPRFGHTASLLQNGQVLIAGGVDRLNTDPGSGPNRGDVLASAELYDPATGTFAATGPMTSAVVSPTATVLKDGRVLIAGGASGMSIYDNYSSGAELYDPATGTFSQTGSMTTDHGEGTAVLLQDGRILMAGGISGAVDVIYPQSAAELFDPATGTFARTGSMTTPRYDQAAALLPDGRVLIAGGSLWGLPTSAELFDPATGTFEPTASMTVARPGCTATALRDGRVLLAGGWSGDPLASAELYQP